MSGFKFRFMQIQISLLVGQKIAVFKLCQFSNCLKIQTNKFFKTGSISQILSSMLGCKHDYRHLFPTYIYFCDKSGVFWVLWFQYPIQYPLWWHQNLFLEASVFSILFVQQICKDFLFLTFFEMLTSPSRAWLWHLFLKMNTL